jgi:hypothetical protein
MKPTEKKVQDNSDSKLESATNTSKEEKTFYQKLMEQGYSESKIGQGFVMTWKKPKQE